MYIYIYIYIYIYVTAILQRAQVPVRVDGHATAVAADQSKQFRPGVGICNWHYLALVYSSPPQIPRTPGVRLERRGLALWHRALSTKQRG